MTKNGITLLSIIDRDKMISGIWDPYFYRENHTGKQLSDFVSIRKIDGKRINTSDLKFEPIEYRNIPKDKFLTFSLEKRKKNIRRKFSVIAEQILLFGTMRAYLGNVLITPKAEWIELKSPVFFPLKSEFVEILPIDDLIYFWWAFFKSSSFLQSLPTGSGGTRPRATQESLLKTPVFIPDIDIRKEIHQNLLILAEKAWNDHVVKEKLLSLL